MNLGPVIKAKETLKVFAKNRPAVTTLLANREAHFGQLHLILPSSVTTGTPVDLTIQVWDQCERLLRDYTQELTVDTTDPDAELPEIIPIDTTTGVTELTGIRFSTPGVQYIRLTDPDTGEDFVSNPIRVTAEPTSRQVFWGDIHLHSHLSDGTGSMDQAMEFGRDVMQLDVVACTDHDTMGFFIPPSLQRRRMRNGYFERMKNVTSSYHDPGEFVTLFAYEWTKQPNTGGHLNIYFDGVEDAELFDSLSPETNTYEKLWARLRAWNATNDTQAVTIPHHPAEAMYPFDFAATEYDDTLAPLVEVYSVWGSSERPETAGNQYPLAMGQGEIDEPGYYVQDALEMGHRVGLTASADYHGPHPGHSLIHTEPHLPSVSEWRDQGVGWGLIWRVWDEQSYPGGLQAFIAPELSRDAIFESLVSRRVYGTTQPDRILVEFQINGVAFGEQDSTVVVETPTTERRVHVDIAGTAPIETFEIVKNNTVWKTMQGVSDPTAPLESFTIEETWSDTSRVTGMAWDGDRGTDADTYYVRVNQANGGMAWAGPLWVTAEEHNRDQ